MARVLTRPRRLWHPTSEGEGQAWTGRSSGGADLLYRSAAFLLKEPRTYKSGSRYLLQNVGARIQNVWCKIFCWGEVTLRDDVQKLCPLETNGGELRGSTHR